MWTYIIGPLIAFLPKGWRKALPFFDSINWARAVTLSGFAEFAISVAGLLQWYSVSMTTWVNRGLDVAMNAGPASGITDHAIGAMAWFMWINHPLTWALGYFTVEGAVRMCGAAFADSLPGSLPLVLIDKTVRLISGKSRVRNVPGAASEFITAVGEKVLESSVPLSADQVSFRRSGTEEIMEICASRRKPGWDPPQVVRVGDTYYRLEEFSKFAGARPFRYQLRRLAAGVPGRKVLLYELEPQPAITNN
jgi:hypothetical protein